MTEMEKLIVKLSDNRVTFDLTFNWNGNTPQVWIPRADSPLCDVICHEFSYGGKDGLLEILCKNWDDVRGWLTADEAYELIVKEVKRADNNLSE